MNVGRCCAWEGVFGVCGPGVEVGGLLVVGEGWCFVYWIWLEGAFFWCCAGWEGFSLEFGDSVVADEFAWLVLVRLLVSAENVGMGRVYARQRCTLDHRGRLVV